MHAEWYVLLFVLSNTSFFVIIQTNQIQNICAGLLYVEVHACTEATAKTTCVRDEDCKSGVEDVTRECTNGLCECKRMKSNLEKKHEQLHSIRPNNDDCEIDNDCEGHCANDDYECVNGTCMCHWDIEWEEDEFHLMIINLLSNNKWKPLLSMLYVLG